MELPASGRRIMDHEATKSSGNLAMENARNLGTFDYFPKSQTGSPWRRACRNASVEETKALQFQPPPEYFQ